MKAPDLVGASSSCPRTTSLIALVMQQVALVLLIRYSRTRDGATVYLASTAVVSAEVGKFVLNLALEITTTWYYEKRMLSIRKLGSELCSRDSWRLVVPAFLYVVQNNLLFVALGNLSVPVYQVTNQGKLLTTALCSRWLLQKRISTMQYVSLSLLAAGVAVVQLSSMGSKATSKVEMKEQNQLLGLVAVISSCFTSGFAGVYFEKVLKSANSNKTKEAASVYMRNCQLAIFSIALALLPVVTTDYPVISEQGFFKGYDATVWLVIFCQTMTGLIVALVMKYADSILKGFCTSVAVVLATLLSIAIFGTSVNGRFALGAAMVVGAVQLYSKFPPPPQSVTSTPDASGAKHAYPWRSVKMLAIPVILCSVVILLSVRGLSHRFSISTAVHQRAYPIPTPNNATQDNVDTISLPNNATQHVDAVPSSIKLETNEQLLKAIASQMQKDEVPYFIMFGTLLGKMRSNSLIQHENDIDLMVSEDDQEKFAKALRNCTSTMFSNEVFVAKFPVKGIIQVTNDPSFRKKSYPRKPREGYVLMDAYTYRESPREKGNGTVLKSKFTKLILQPKHFLPTQSVPFYLKESKENITVSVPSQPAVIMEFLYGKQWGTPINDNRGRNRTGSPYCGAENRFGYEWAECHKT